MLFKIATLSIFGFQLISANYAADKLRQDLYKRAEEYQPVISEDFPHKLGAERVLNWMDTSYDPCTDFYKFSCGGFQKRYQGDQKMGQSNSILMEQIMMQKGGDSLATTPTEKKLFEKAERYFSSCLDTAAISSRDFKPIIPFAKRIVKNCENKLDLPRVVGSLHKDAVFAFFRVQYSKVEGHSSEDLRLQIWPSVAYDLEVEKIESILKPFFKHDIVSLPKDLSVQDIARWVAAIEKVLARFVEDVNHAKLKGDSQSQYTTIDHLSSSTQLDWSAYLDIVGLGEVKKIYLHGDAALWMSVLGRLYEINNQHMKFYLLYRLGVSHYNKLSEYYFTMTAELSQSAVRSLNEDPSDKMDVFQKNCIDEIGVHLVYLSSNIYSKYAFDDQQRAEATDMINHLKDAFGREINQLTWMDEKTKRAAQEKLDNLVFIVGYPDWSKNAEKVDEYYKDIDFVHDSYFENAVSVQYFAEFSPSWHQVGREWIRSELLFGYPWQLNAFHLTDMLQIQINTGILQRPLFSHKNRASSNYGSLGMIIGHEVSHGFDSIGRKIDYNGELSSWWSDHATRLFSRSAFCFIDQYDQYYVEMQDPYMKPAQVSGKLTLSENIADNGGLHVAYSAWIRHMEGKNVDKPMEEYNGLTDEQLFFVSFGQTWCAVDDDKQTLFLVHNDPHSPNPVRVNGVVANSHKFHRAFGCKKRAPTCALY